ncbi:unnamed protein product [Protopolystoma xenopodis]|uniref:Uncharacterized protein n=1 Tax=Protopolystoma xenopodis TaxID=117903 RepID=A0A3S5BLA0_9PLAT|nr:unnamed protein product [Protopolystoma xenopodis]
MNIEGEVPIKSNPARDAREAVSVIERWRDQLLRSHASLKKLVAERIHEISNILTLFELLRDSGELEVSI